MPSSSRSNSSVPSRRSIQRTENINKINQPGSTQKQRRNSSCQRSLSVKSVNQQKQKIERNKSPSNSSVASNIKSERKNSIKNSSAGSNHKRNRKNSSMSRSKSPQVRQMVKKNSSDKSERSKKSRQKNDWNEDFNNKNNDGDFRGRGRGRGRGDRGGRGRGGRGGGNFNRDRDFNNEERNFNDERRYNNRERNFNQDSQSNCNNTNNNQNKNGYRNNVNNNNGYDNNNFRSKFNNTDTNNFNNSLHSSGSRHSNSVDRFSNKQLPVIKQEIKKTPQQLRLEEFYHTHKTEGWFRQKYNPILLICYQREHQQYVKKAQAEFQNLLKEGHFDHIDLTIEDYKFLGQLQFQQKEIGQSDDKTTLTVADLYLNPSINIKGPPLYGIQKDNSTVFAPQISKQISRYDLYNVVSMTEAFQGLILSQPSRKNDFKRMAWIEYQDEIKANQALIKLRETLIKQNKIQFTKASQRLSKVKIVLNYPEIRVEQDLAKSIEIASKLDKEMKIQASNQLHAHKFNSSRQKLYTVITYLRRVHFYEYFDCKFYDSFRTLTVKSGLAILFVEAEKNTEIQIDELTKLDLTNRTIIQKGSAQFRKNQTQKIQILTEAIKKNIYEIQNFNPQISTAPKYWKCTECYKKFQGIDYLVKHTISRHQQLIQEIVSQAQMQIYMKTQEQWEKRKNERAGSKNERHSKLKRRNYFLKDFDEPEQQQVEQIQQRLKPVVSKQRKLINFLDI